MLAVRAIHNLYLRYLCSVQTKSTGGCSDIFLTNIRNDLCLMLIKIKYSRYNNRRVRTHESDSEVTVHRLGTIKQRIFFCSIRSRHSQIRLEMVWRESFPKGSCHFRRYDFCPVYLVSPRLTGPGSPRMQ